MQRESKLYEFCLLKEQGHSFSIHRLHSNIRYFMLKSIPVYFLIYSSFNNS
jgi:hypothetical protein